MLSAFQVFLAGLTAFFLANILVGLIQPVWVLWFLDRFNRRKVLSFYGKLFLLSLALTILVSLV